MKKVLCSGLGMMGSALVSVLGGWDTALATLIIFMAADYVSGLMVAGIFKKSPKTNNGTLESRAGFKGLCRKSMVLLFVLIGDRLDLILGTDYVRTAVIIAFLTNELISLIENAGLMGVPLPAIITRAVEILQQKSGYDGTQQP